MYTLLMTPKPIRAMAAAFSSGRGGSNIFSCVACAVNGMLLNLTVPSDCLTPSVADHAAPCNPASVCQRALEYLANVSLCRCALNVCELLDLEWTPENALPHS